MTGEIKQTDVGERVIRPTAKFIKLGYAAAVVFLIVAIVIHTQWLDVRNQPPWLPVLAALLLLWPIKRHIQRQFVKVTISQDKLCSESGLFSKTMRIIHLAKVQDVRVNQSLGQRMFGIGNIWIETAGEASRLTIPNIDSPRALADEILEKANKDQPAHGL